LIAHIIWKGLCINLVFRLWFWKVSHQSLNCFGAEAHPMQRKGVLSQQQDNPLLVRTFSSQRELVDLSSIASTNVAKAHIQFLVAFMSKFLSHRFPSLRVLFWCPVCIKFSCESTNFSTDISEATGIILTSYIFTRDNFLSSEAS